MNVLIAVDGSEHAQRLVGDTVRLLQGALGDIWLLHVAEPDPDFVGYEIEPVVMRDQLAQGFHQEHRQLQAMAEALRGRGFAANALLIQGETVKTILQQAEKLNADLIVVGASGHGRWHDFLAGEVSLAGLQASGRPLLVMPLPK
jgi:nucleotide-binding universal stress UspA family protein